jgi:hypothetical protein
MEFYELPECTKMRIEGRLVRDYAEHARSLVGHTKTSNLVVDLSEVSFVDQVGEEVLLWFKEIGVGFTADSVYSRHVCERLQLPILSRAIADPQRRKNQVRRRSQEASGAAEQLRGQMQNEVQS